MNLLEVYNLIFLLPLLFGILLQLFSLTGFVGDFDMDADVDVPTSLSILGLGKAPLMIIITSFCTMWGISGYISNTLFSKIPLSPYIYVWGSLAIALIISLLFTRKIAFLVAKIMPSTESYLSTKSDLIGKTGKALYDVTTKQGNVHVYDQFDTLLELSCRIRSEESVISSDSTVVLMEYIEEGNYYYVQPSKIEHTSSINLR